MVMSDAKTRVGNIRDYRNWTDDIVYIGRRCKWHKRWLKKSMFANPFKIGDKHPEREGEVIDRAESIALYKDWFHKQLDTEPGFAEAVEELRGKVLLCWCAPLDCHGRIIKEYLERSNDVKH
jgi:hypothetical protein